MIDELENHKITSEAQQATKADATKTSKSEFSKKTKTAIAREKWFDAGHTIPPCVNSGCVRCVEVRSWSIGGTPSLKTECRPCSHARKCNKPLEGITFHKKNYCENIDGFLGFKCPVPPDMIRNFSQSVFELEHVDGNHWNDTHENVKTLCCLCHREKTSLSKDADSTKESSMRNKK